MELDHDRYMMNVKKPMKDEYGEAQLLSMNERHNQLALWGISHLEEKGERVFLDVGCGGGKNIQNILERTPLAKVYGLDYSEASVEMSIKHNQEQVDVGNVVVKQGTAEDIPFNNNTFDIVTGFETIYFWDLKKSFDEVFRVLKEGGRFMIVNECDNPEDLKEASELVGFKVFTMDEIVAQMKESGFNIVQKDRSKDGKWIVVIGEK